MPSETRPATFRQKAPDSPEPRSPALDLLAGAAGGQHTGPHPSLLPVFIHSFPERALLSAKGRKEGNPVLSPKVWS